MSDGVNTSHTEVHERKEAEESLFDEDEFDASEAGDTNMGDGGDDFDFDDQINEALQVPDEPQEQEESDEESNDDESEGCQF
jgi:hypothetical protein